MCGGGGLVGGASMTLWKKLFAERRAFLGTGYPGRTFVVAGVPKDPDQQGSVKELI